MKEVQLEGVLLFHPSSAWAFLPTFYDVEAAITSGAFPPWAGSPRRKTSSAFEKAATTMLMPLPRLPLLSIIDSSMETLCTTVEAYSIHLGIPTTSRSDNKPGMAMYIADFMGAASPAGLLSVDIRGLTLMCSRATDAAFAAASWAQGALDTLSTFEFCRLVHFIFQQVT